MTEKDQPCVEVFPAIEFICDKCGRNNYNSVVSAEKSLTESEFIDFYKKVMGTKPPKDGKANWLVVPSKVTCSHCSTTYNTFQGMMEDVPDEPFQGFDAD